MHSPRLTKFLHRWDRWWTRTSPPHLLAIFRIAFGGFLLFYFALQIPHITMLYSRETVLLPAIDQTHWLGLLFAPPPPWVAQMLFSTFFTCLTLFTIGAWTRGASVLLFLLYVYYWILSLHQFGTSFDRLFLFILLTLCFSGCGKAYSVDMKLAKGSWLAWEPISILPQRLIAVQITATYLGVGWQKIILDDWQSGEVFIWGFIGRWATAPAWWIARQDIPIWVYDAVVVSIKWFEVLMPFGLWSKRWRWVFFCGGFLFHVGIAILLAIWWFVVLIPAYIVFFEPEEVADLLPEGPNCQ